MIRYTVKMPSTHRKERTQKITKLVIHSMAEYVDDMTKARHASHFLELVGLSAHALITPQGYVIETVPLDKVAWHCKGINGVSFGVEFLVEGVYGWDSFKKRIRGVEPVYTLSQLAAGVEWVGRELAKLPDWEEIEMVMHMNENTKKPDPGRWFPFTDFKEKVECRARKYVQGE